MQHCEDFPSCGQGEIADDFVGVSALLSLSNAAYKNAPACKSLEQDFHFEKREDQWPYL